jgi:hypothetical protein
MTEVVFFVRRLGRDRQHNKGKNGRNQVNPRLNRIRQKTDRISQIIGQYL